MAQQAVVAPHPASDPAHADHAAFRWGHFLALLAVALQISGQVVNPYNPKLAAAIAGGGQVLGQAGVALAE